MSDQHPIEMESLDSLTGRAIEALNESVPGIVEWIDRIRPEDGTPGRFRWALETTREANVASTSYVLGGLRRMGLVEEVITDEDRRAGAEWIRSMHIGNEQYRDPALMGRKSPNWPEDEPWPSPGMLNGLNGYARGVLNNYEGNTEVTRPADPPPGWPQPDDDPAEMIQWIKTRPWDTNPWGAGSHAMRMARWMLGWHKEGRLPLEPVVEALQFFYDTQNPETGLWGGPETPMFQRINGTFKLFPLIREQLHLPLPRADKIIDNVLSEFYRPDYDETVGGCDEWDNWFVIGHCLDEIPDYRRDEIREVAVWRLTRIFEVFGKPDGGWSYGPDQCATSWIGFDMAPAIPQGDAMGPGVIAPAVNVCVALAGLHDASPWTGEWRMRGSDSGPDELREEILALLKL